MWALRFSSVKSGSALGALNNGEMQLNKLGKWLLSPLYYLLMLPAVMRPVRIILAQLQIAKTWNVFSLRAFECTCCVSVKKFCVVCISMCGTHFIRRLVGNLRFLVQPDIKRLSIPMKWFKEHIFYCVDVIPNKTGSCGHLGEFVHLLCSQLVLVYVTKPHLTACAVNERNKDSFNKNTFQPFPSKPNYGRERKSKVSASTSRDTMNHYLLLCIASWSWVVFLVLGKGTFRFLLNNNTSVIQDELYFRIKYLIITSKNLKYKTDVICLI